MIDRAMLCLFCHDRLPLLRVTLASLRPLPAWVTVHAHVDGAGPVADWIAACPDIEHATVTPTARGSGYQRHKALDDFLARPEYDGMVFCDSDIAVAPDTLEAMRDALEFWWAHDYPTGMLCGGTQKLNDRRVRYRAGRSMVYDRGWEALMLLPRGPLEQVGNHFDARRRSGELAVQKNALRYAGHARITQREPLIQMQHMGAFMGGISAHAGVDALLMRDVAGAPINPRPDLIDFADWREDPGAAADALTASLSGVA